MTRLLTVPQAAEALQLHPETVRRHLRAGTLHGVYVGSVWRIPEDSLPHGGIPRATPAPREATGKYARLVREIQDGAE